MLGRQEEVTLSFALLLSGCVAAGSSTLPPPDVVELGPTPQQPALTAVASSGTGDRRIVTPRATPLRFERDWRTVLDARGARSTKPLLVWVRAEWSVASLEFERSGALEQPEAVSLGASFERLWIDVTEPTPELESVLQSLDVATVPSLVLMGCVTPPERRVVVAPTPALLTSALAGCLDDLH